MQRAGDWLEIPCNFERTFELPARLQVLGDNIHKEVEMEDQHQDRWGTDSAAAPSVISHISQVKASHASNRHGVP